RWPGRRRPGCRRLCGGRTHCRTKVLLDLRGGALVFGEGVDLAPLALRLQRAPGRGGANQGRFQFGAVDLSKMVIIQNNAPSGGRMTKPMRRPAIVCERRRDVRALERAE